jgi:acetylornithine deacetylase/succinyl-diaminopimelate desuccinylase-like protein
MKEFLQSAGNPPRAWGESQFHVLERIWARPTLDVNGIWGGYQGEGAKTVLPAKAGAKISMRLVPDQTPEEAERKFTAFVKRIAPPSVKVTVRALHGGSPFLCPTDAPEFQATERALQRAFGRKPVLIREGGSIPFTATIQEALGVPVILMGFGLPDENSHAPDEHLDLENYQRGILSAVYLYEELAAARTAPAAPKQRKPAVRKKAGGKKAGARPARRSR